MRFMRSPGFAKRQIIQPDRGRQASFRRPKSLSPWRCACTGLTPRHLRSSKAVGSRRMSRAQNQPAREGSPGTRRPRSMSRCTRSAHDLLESRASARKSYRSIMGAAQNRCEMELMLSLRYRSLVPHCLLAHSSFCNAGGYGQPLSPLQSGARKRSGRSQTR